MAGWDRTYMFALYTLKLSFYDTILYIYINSSDQLSSTTFSLLP